MQALLSFTLFRHSPAFTQLYVLRVKAGDAGNACWTRKVNQFRNFSSLTAFAVNDRGMGKKLSKQEKEVKNTAELFELCLWKPLENDGANRLSKVNKLLALEADDGCVNIRFQDTHGCKFISTHTQLSVKLTPPTLSRVPLLIP